MPSLAHSSYRLVPAARIFSSATPFRSGDPCHYMGKKNKPAGKAAAAPSKPSTARNFGVLGLLGVGLALVLQAFLSSNATPPAPSRAAGEVPKHEKRAGKKAKAVVPEPTGPPAVCPEGWTNCPRVPGANWVELEALATSPVVAPTAEALEGCHAPHSLLSPQRVPGMHLLCLLPPPPESTAAVTIAIFKDMERTEFFADGQPRPAAVLLLPQLQTAEQAVAALVRRLHIVRKSPLYQPPALFTDSGVRLQTAAILTSPRADGGGDAGSPVRRLLCMEGGQWIWPPVEVRVRVHSVRVDAPSPPALPTVSLLPPIRTRTRGRAGRARLCTHLAPDARRPPHQPSSEVSLRFPHATSCRSPPSSQVGHVTLLPDLTAKGVTTRVVTLSLKPLVVEVKDFLTTAEARARAPAPIPNRHWHTPLAHAMPPELHSWQAQHTRDESSHSTARRSQADHIVDRALPHMAKSGVALKDADKGKAAKEFRTSSQYFLPTTRDPVLERVDKRVMYLTRIPISHAEYIQVPCLTDRQARLQPAEQPAEQRQATQAQSLQRAKRPGACRAAHKR